jgi:hypothetical protein
VLDPEGLREKLESVRRSTLLKQEMRTSFRTDGSVTRDMAPQDWVVVYGRIETRKELRPPRGRVGEPGHDWGNGFGQMGVAPAQIVSRPENRFVIRDNEMRR